jgi:hypothetical protein
MATFDDDDEEFSSLRGATIERIKDTLILPSEALTAFERMSLDVLGFVERFALDLKIYFERTNGLWDWYSNSEFELKFKPKDSLKQLYVLVLPWTPLLTAMRLRSLWDDSHARVDKSEEYLEYDIAPAIIRQNPAIKFVSSRANEGVVDAIVASKHVTGVMIKSPPGGFQGNLGNLASSQVTNFTFCDDLDLGAFFEVAVQTGRARVLVLTDWKPKDLTLASDQVAKLIRVGKLKSIALFSGHAAETIALALKSNTLIEYVKWNTGNIAPFCKALESNCSISHVDMGRCSWSNLSPYIAKWRGVLRLSFTQCELFNRLSLYSFGYALCLNQSLTKLDLRCGPEHLQMCFIPSTYMGVFLRKALTGNGTLEYVEYDKKIISKHKDVSERNLKGVMFPITEKPHSVAVIREPPRNDKVIVSLQHGLKRKRGQLRSGVSLDRFWRHIAHLYSVSPLRLSLATSNGIHLSFASPLNHTKTIADLGPDPVIYLSTGDRASVVFCWLALRSLISSEPESEPESESGSSKGKRKGSPLNSVREMKRSRRLGFNLADLPFELIQVIVKHMGPPAKTVLF